MAGKKKPDEKKSGKKPPAKGGREPDEKKPGKKPRKDSRGRRIVPTENEEGLVGFGRRERRREHEAPAEATPPPTPATSESSKPKARIRRPGVLKRTLWVVTPPRWVMVVALLLVGAVVGLCLYHRVWPLEGARKIQLQLREKLWPDRGTSPAPTPAKGWDSEKESPKNFKGSIESYP